MVVGVDNQDERTQKKQPCDCKEGVLHLLIADHNAARTQAERLSFLDLSPIILISSALSLNDATFKGSAAGFLPTRIVTVLVILSPSIVLHDYYSIAFSIRQQQSSCG
jgi:hypothetical protein